MSDLQCPATFLVLGWDPGSGEADGGEPVSREARGQQPGVAGVAAAAGVPGMTGLAELTELADELGDRRVAAVCSGRDVPALAVAQALAAQLGAVHRSIEGLDPLPARRACAAVPGADATGPDVTGPDDPGADSHGAGTSAARYRAALDALADLYRGETVLVVTDARMLTTLWPATHGGEALSSYRLVTVQVDGDGWRLLGRPGGG